MTNTAMAQNITEQFDIPPRPQALIDVEREMKSEMPDIGVIADAIRDDVAISGAVLQVINSPFFRLPEKVSSVAQAIRFLGLKKVSAVVRHVALKNSLGDGGLESFWDTATDVAEMSSLLALRLTGIEPDEAHAAGLFHDCGLPLLVQMYPVLKDSLLDLINQPMALSAAEIEMCGVDHYEIGAIVGTKWFLPEVITTSISMLPKAEQILTGKQVELEPVKQLLALILMAKNLNCKYRRANEVMEELADGVLDFFELTQADYEDLSDSIILGLNK